MEAEQWITIVNYERFCPRKDISRPTWMRLENNLMFEPQFEDFSAEEFWVLVCLISFASQRNEKSFLYRPSFVARHSRVTEAVALSAIGKLERIGVVEVGPRNGGVTSTSRERDEDGPQPERGRTESARYGSNGRDGRDGGAPNGGGVPPEAQATEEELAAAYQAGLEKQYGKTIVADLTSPAAKAASRALRLTIPRERLLALVETFCTMDTKWFTEKGHALGALVGDVQKVEAERAKRTGGKGTGPPACGACRGKGQLRARKIDGAGEHRFACSACAKGEKIQRESNIAFWKPDDPLWEVVA